MSGQIYKYSEQMLNRLVTKCLSTRGYIGAVFARDTEDFHRIESRIMDIVSTQEKMCATRYNSRCNARFRNGSMISVIDYANIDPAARESTRTHLILHTMADDDDD